MKQKFDIKKLKEWFEDILIIKYKKERKSKLRLENVKEMLK